MIKMFKKSIFICVVMLLAFCSIAFGMDNLESKLLENKINSSEERDEVKEQCIKNKDKIIKSVLELNRTGASDILTDEIYKVYHMKAVAQLDKWNANSSVEDIISDKYHWEAPIVDSNKGFVTTITLELLSQEQINDMRTEETKVNNIVNNNNEWVITTYGNIMPIEGIEFVADNSMFSELMKSNNINDIEKVKIISLPNFTYGIFIKANSGAEYIIPFNRRTDFSELENGKVYEANEVLSKFTTLFHQTKSIDDIKFGGSPSNNNAYIYIIIGIVIIGVFLASFLGYKKLRKSNT